MLMVPLKTIEALQWHPNFVLKVQKVSILSVGLNYGLGTYHYVHLSQNGICWDCVLFRSFSRVKPLMTIVPEFGENNEKPLMSMVNM